MIEKVHNSLYDEFVESGERMKLEENSGNHRSGTLYAGLWMTGKSYKPSVRILMSDVLTVEADDAVLITGLANIQAIRTAEMADISCILFVRDKEITPNMIRFGR